MFDKLVWQSDRMLLNNLVFRLEPCREAYWDLGDNCFLFHKTKPLVDQYEKFWSSRPQFHPQNLMELGIWDGGSIAFWFEYFQPARHVGVDLQKRSDSNYFRRYIAERRLEARIKTHWSTNQTDGQKLRAIVDKEFGSSLDLVIDDASHLYEPTKQSFETLFPFLRPGGLYVIEDWAWAHWSAFQTPDHPWKAEMPLTRLVFELTALVGSWEGDRPELSLISNLSVFQGFIVIERGGLKLPTADFRLAQYLKNDGGSMEFKSRRAE